MNQRLRVVLDWFAIRLAPASQPSHRQDITNAEAIERFGLLACLTALAEKFVGSGILPADELAALLEEVYGKEGTPQSEWEAAADVCDRLRGYCLPHAIIAKNP